MNIWKEVLETNEITVNNNFFQLGGNSVLAIRIISYIEKEFSLKLSFDLFFTGPSIFEIAETIKNYKTEIRQTDFTKAENILMQSDKINLICLPFAGGNVNSYKGLQKQLTDKFNMVNIELPGRGIRRKEALLNNIEAIVEDVYSQLKKYLDQPYAIYGHSMGTLIAYELCKKIQTQNLPLPIHLFVSGKSGPSAHLNYTKLHDLPKNQFWIEVKDLGGVPQEILNEPELMDYFEPVLRADLKAVEEYQYKNGSQFNFPITTIIGDQENITDENAILWQKETTSPLYFHKFPGNHFFIFNNFPQLAEIIMTGLQ